MPLARHACSRMYWTLLDCSLLDVDGRVGFLELLLELLGVGLRQTFLDFAGYAFDQVLGFLQAQARGCADDLDYADLLVAEACELDGKLGLLFLGLGSAAAASSPGGHHHHATATGGGLDAVDVLEVVAQFLGLLQGQAKDL